MKKQEIRIVSHIISLVLGILSIITVFFWYLSLPTGITSIILGVKAYKYNGSKLGMAGFITGIIGISICVFIYITLIMILILNNY